MVPPPEAVIAFPLYLLHVPIWAAGEERPEEVLRHSGRGLLAAQSALVLPTGWVIDRLHCPGWVTAVADLVSFQRTVPFKTGARIFMTD
jgi:hypothetical protein